MAESTQFGVRCTMANGEDFIVTLDALDEQDALEQVQAHQALFYGPGDAAGRWLTGMNPRTLKTIHEAKPLSEWNLDRESA